MKSFVLGISGLIVVCFIAGLILEGTKLEKTANKTLGIIITVSLLMSVITLFFNVKNDNFSDFNFDIDQNYIQSVTDYKLQSLKDNIVSSLEKQGIKQSEVYFNSVIENNEVVIEKIHVDLTKAEYDSSTMNINKIKDCVSNLTNVNKENVLVYLREN